MKPLSHYARVMRGRVAMSRKEQLRAWLEHVIAEAIDMLDTLDAPETDLEDDELEMVAYDD